MTTRVFTIGAYGFTPGAFFGALAESGVDMFLDVRQRRGLRGSRYAFANAGRLVPELEARGIAYRHLKGLAPGSEIRQMQREADAAAGEVKSSRTALSPTFVHAYEQRRAGVFDWTALAAELTGYRAPVIFCVEQHPEQCHRSLVAPRLAGAFGGDVVHLTP
jgi:uncharacterized protein (DUF488 family)